MDPLLAGIGLSRRGEGGARIFRPLDIEIGAGERVALVGPSGSGKTLALRLLALLDSPDAGEVRWRGAPIENEEVPRHRRRVHLLAQGAAMAPGTGMDNLELAFSVGVAGSRFPRERAAGLLEELGAGAIVERDVTELSGGERQLIALCRALLVEPQILLLDEVTSALDPDRTARAERAVEAWLEGPGRAALWVSHDAAQRDRVADRIVEVHRG